MGFALVLLIPAGCGPRQAPPTVAVPPELGGPEIRVGLLVNAPAAQLGGSSPLAATAPDGSHLWMIPAGEIWQAASVGSRFTLSSRGWTSEPLEAIRLTPTQSNALVRVNGRGYRGSLVIMGSKTGLTVINRVGMESYLLGVVSAEMGRRSPSEQAALRAQAIVSRTYAWRKLDRWRTQGFDLTATVANQVYGGIGVETSEGRAAVLATQGQLLTYEGAPIEAFFYSTCGGRTADGAEVFRGAKRSYLRSIADRAENGIVYCSISPRYRWHEEWSGEALRTTLQRYLPDAATIRSADIRQISNVRVARRSSSGRVDQLAIGLGGREVKVEGPKIRQVMRLSSGEPLRSTVFDLVATLGAEGVSHLSVDGAGSGHGVGFCQWGAVGRARAGQGYEQILAAYFPGTRLERRY